MAALIASPDDYFTPEDIARNLKPLHDAGVLHESAHADDTHYPEDLIDKITRCLHDLKENHFANKKKIDDPEGGSKMFTVYRLHYSVKEDIFIS